MIPKEDKIFGAFLESPLAPLEGVSTYEYMKNLNVYLNSCSSVVDYTLRYGTLGYLVLSAQPAMFNTHCVTRFITPRNPGIHPVMLMLISCREYFNRLLKLYKGHKENEWPVVSKRGLVIFNV